mmetsp:Transcript_43584/g.93325  ORF Transcript_43584/g.93325 Transcript_43584/m.93325 type:complete len:221 (-) Transcript_43584:306-968(-)|eukprot:CAMPEP_0206468848 /NCGR_PEP_ID=MMETSP0324_2-20121206/29891_1 /ASSEMBLY_ACC=CAM_ASM_000836 /TAXON_ID=2866 /ORGANISM="Crypthecodinium cohnii, Strain Seligo" /LENGTH=220 /DNA_ID=CAMNT_0053942419 /DNA_START=151 /DNA_END=813 /DNA_ORIENTATION=-
MNDDYEHLGPGTYVGHQLWTNPLKPAAKPFNTASERFSYNRPPPSSPSGEGEDGAKAKHPLFSNDRPTGAHLGPGAYLAHTPYAYAEAKKAFNCGSPRFSVVGGEKPLNRPKHTPTAAHLGPGSYVGQREWASPKDRQDSGKKGFGSSVDLHDNEKSKTERSKKMQDAHLGPGLYVGHKEYRIDPAKAPFGSKAPRFNPTKRERAKAAAAAAAAAGQIPS